VRDEPCPKANARMRGCQINALFPKGLARDETVQIFALKRHPMADGIGRKGVKEAREGEGAARAFLLSVTVNQTFKSHRPPPHSAPKLYKVYRKSRFFCKL
jgi:hypothetical protein